MPASNASLTYEILLYLNSFYFGMFGGCEIGMALLKAVNLKFPQGALAIDTTILVVTFVIETLRIYLGRKGALSDYGWQVLTSVVLTVPSALGICYLLFFQTETLNLELILCALMLLLQLTELFFAIMFVFTICRPVSYD
jgi:transmembrane protein 216